MINWAMAPSVPNQMQQKLSPEQVANFLRWRLERGKAESIPTLLQWLEQQAEFRTAADETLLTVSKTRHVQHPNAVKPQKLGPSSASCLVVPTSSEVCLLCQDGHDKSCQFRSFCTALRINELILRILGVTIN